jgi:hypothetical protein
MTQASENPQIKWLFERNVFDDGTPAAMAKLVRAAGMACAEVAFESVGGDERQLRPVGRIPFDPDDAVFVYGSMNLMKWLLHQQKWPKLAWYDFRRLCCQRYYAHWGQYLLQRRYAFLPLAEVNRRKDWVFETFARNESVFIRPDDNAKSFSGGVVHRDGFSRWYELANFYEPGPDCLAVVSAPQVIHAEWRLVIGGGKVVTASQYRREGREEVSAGYPAEAAAFAETVTRSNSFEPHPTYVMDVASTDDGYRLIEIGSVCCASLYACDLERLVNAIVELGSDERLWPT